VNPSGLGSVSLSGAGTQDARLNLSVPAGTRHDAWHANTALRVLQPTADTDFTAELKFDSVPSQKFQTQGLLVQEDGDDWARFDVFWNGSALRAYAATTVGGVTTKRLEKSVPAGTSVWLRVDRSGDTWQLQTSTNGTSWATVGSFAHALDVTASGPYAGNSGSPVPAFTSLVDYVFETASPVVPEDTAVPDTTPPAVTGVAVAPGSTAATVTWTTDEPATSSVRVGTTTAYGHGTFGSSTPTTNHSVQVTGLTPGTTYHYRVASTDGAGLTTTTADATFATSVAAGPVIDVWGGASQAFGTRGTPQERTNVNGNVSDPDGIAALTYSLNGGPARNLTLGPNNRRLQAPGDFNADIPYAELGPGANTVRLTARDLAGNVTTRDVTVTRQSGAATLPFTTDWGSASRIGDHGQVVDGKWRLEGDTVRVDRMGYDRIVAVGDTSWHDYEMTVPVTVHGLGPGNGSYLSGNSLVGFGLNWRGHQQVNNEQPGYMWYPTGALGWYRWYETTPRFELFGNGNSPVQRHSRTQLQFGRTYMFKARSDTVAGGVQYSWKVWPQGQAEPAAWDLTLLEDSGPATGSLILIAHHADVQFGNVTVTSIP
jgi:regulation of enolase protein 1 (concanavalin A-like superfamily)